MRADACPHREKMQVRATRELAQAEAGRTSYRARSAEADSPGRLLLRHAVQGAQSEHQIAAGNSDYFTTGKELRNRI